MPRVRLGVIISQTCCLPPAARLHDSPSDINRRFQDQLAALQSKAPKHADSATGPAAAPLSSSAEASRRQARQAAHNPFALPHNHRHSHSHHSHLHHPHSHHPHLHPPHSLTLTTTYTSQSASSLAIPQKLRAVRLPIKHHHFHARGVAVKSPLLLLPAAPVSSSGAQAAVAARTHRSHQTHVASAGG
jgi:hypothetical protein